MAKSQFCSFSQCMHQAMQTAPQTQRQVLPSVVVLLRNAFCWSSRETICRLAAHGNASSVLSSQRWAHSFQPTFKSLISGITHSTTCWLPEIVEFWFWNKESRFPLTLGYGKLHCGWRQIFLCCPFQTPTSRCLHCRGEDLDAVAASLAGEGPRSYVGGSLRESVLGAAWF